MVIAVTNAIAVAVAIENPNRSSPDVNTCVIGLGSELALVQVSVFI